MPPVISPKDPIEILDNLPTDELVLTVIAEDPDTGLNGKIMFEIIDGNTENVFKIDMVCFNVFTLL